MLKKAQRLKTEDFKALPETQKKYTENFTLRYKVSAPGGSLGRFAVVAPKKLYKLAVLRNKAKRLVYSALEGIKLNKNDIFIFINKDILKLNKDQILAEIGVYIKNK